MSIYSPAPIWDQCRMIQNKRRHTLQNSVKPNLPGGTSAERAYSVNPNLPVPLLADGETEVGLGYLSDTDGNQPSTMYMQDNRDDGAEPFDAATLLALSQTYP